MSSMNKRMVARGQAPPTRTARMSHGTQDPECLDLQHHTSGVEPPESGRRRCRCGDLTQVGFGC